MSSPTLSGNGVVYIGTEIGSVYALASGSGVELDEYKIGEILWSSAALDSQGILYIGSIDKRVYAIKVSQEKLGDNPWPMRGQNPQHTGRAGERQ